MRGTRKVWPLGLGAGGVFGLLSLSAWLQVQSTRLSYRAHAIRLDLDRLDRQEQAERRRLELALSLERLDQFARSRRGLAPPRPDQVRLLRDDAR